MTRERQPNDRECEWWLGFDLSVAVVVGFIALAGVVIMKAIDFR